LTPSKDTEFAESDFRASPVLVRKDSLRACSYLGVLVFGYIGVYLCRKNLSVAVPLIREAFHASKEQVGRIASVGTLAYALGKVTLGPVIDRFGGRVCFVFSLALVGLFGALGGFAPSLSALAFFYALNRYAGAGSWGSMVKQTPAWFSSKNLALAMGVLSLSYVLGGAASIALAGQIAYLTKQNWRLILGLPSAIIIIICILCLIFLPKTKPRSSVVASDTCFDWVLFKSLFGSRTFWAVCALSFTLTLLRETFNDWTVDYIKTEGGQHLSIQIAAFLSTPFDLCGAAGILVIGSVLGRLTDRQRSYMLSVILLALTIVLLSLPFIAKLGLTSLVPAIGLVGFLALGPYSLLAGYYSVQIKGPECAATVAGIVDSLGYVAGILAGFAFGWVLDHGGYTLGFQLLATLSFISAGVVFFLKESKPINTL
jgi:sugar phosphate permease